MNVALVAPTGVEESKLPPEPVTSGLLGVKVCNSWDELEALRPTWERLLHTSAACTIFSTPEWLGPWWNTFGQGKQTATLVFSDSSGEAVGLALLYFDFVETLFRRRLKRLRLLGDGSGDSDNLDFIVRAEYEESCARTFMAWLARQTDWQLCDLNALAARSGMGKSLLGQLKKLGWTYFVYHPPCSALALPDSWESYVSQLSRNERENVRRYPRRLAKSYQVQFYKVVQESELATSLETLFQLHQKRWRLRGEQGSFSSTSRREFYSEMARSFLARQWLEFWLLKLDGRIAAAQFGFRYGNTVYSLQEGFDPVYFLIVWDTSFEVRCSSSSLLRVCADTISSAVRIPARNDGAHRKAATFSSALPSHSPWGVPVSVCSKRPKQRRSGSVPISPIPRSASSVRFIAWCILPRVSSTLPSQSAEGLHASDLRRGRPCFAVLN